MSHEAEADRRKFCRTKGSAHLLFFLVVGDLYLFIWARISIQPTSHTSILIRIPNSLGYLKNLYPICVI
jgi:hypothetical protein